MRVESPTYFFRWGVIVASGVLLLLLQQGGLDGSIRQATYWLLRPGLSATRSLAAGSRSVQYTWRFVREGGDRLAVAEHELSQQWVSAEQIRQLEKENALLRQELGGSRLRAPLYRLYGGGQSWFVDGGCRQGIQPGQSVTFSGGLVGQISTVEDTFSTVQVLQNRSFRLPVLVGTASAQGIFETSRGAPEVTQLSARDAVVSGDRVITQGFERIPPGLPMGTVLSVQTEPATGLSRALVEPVFRLGEIEWVSVLQEVEEGTCP